MENQGFLVRKPGFATVAVHAAQDSEKWQSRAVVPPIVTSTTFKQEAPDLINEPSEFIYGRLGNPTRNTLEECLAALEGGKYAFTFSSGLGATTTVYSLLSKGDHIICCNDIYGGTNKLFRQVTSKMGIEVTFTDCTNIEKVKKELRDNTKMIWIETPSNPMMSLTDIKAISKLAKSHSDIIVAVDNTFLTPYFQRPLDFGADISVYSVTKYINGHSDVIMGAAIVNDDNIAERLKLLRDLMGAIPSPMDCYLVNRSLKTLALRMEQHKKSSLVIANWLKNNPHVIEVMHPGLPEHPQHELAKKQTYGHSGVFSFKHSGGLKESKKLLTSLKMFTLAVSLGGYESLAELPSLMTHAPVPEKQRLDLGITDSVIRLSIGLEDPEDLIKDLEQAFNVTF